jgi:hypothetical protein
VERGEVTKNQLQREMTDLAARVRMAAEEHPTLRQNLEGGEPAAGAHDTDIFETMAETIGEKGRMSPRPANVDESVHEMESTTTGGLRRGEGRAISGRIRGPDPELAPGRDAAIKQWARAQARERHGLAVAEAINDPSKHTPLTLKTLEQLESMGLEHVEAVRTTGQLPAEMDFSHLETVADAPQVAHMGEDVGHGEVHTTHIGDTHAGEVSAPLELSAPRSHPTQEQFGLHTEFDPAHGGSLRESTKGVMRESREAVPRLERQAERLTRQADSLEETARRIQERDAQRTRSPEAAQRAAEKAARRADRIQELRQAAAQKASEAERLRAAIPEMDQIMQTTPRENRRGLGRR